MSIPMLARYIPKFGNTREVPHPAGLGVVYCYGEKKPCAIAYRGKANRPAWNYSFQSEEKRQAAIDQFFESLDAHKKRIAESRTEASKPHSFKVGDVIYNSWGYDQTNVDWYQIVKVSANYVWLKPLCCHIEETGFMCGNSMPLPNQFVENGEVTKHRAYVWGNSQSIAFKYGSGSKWDGRNVGCSWYA